MSSEQDPAVEAQPGPTSPLNNIMLNFFDAVSRELQKLGYSKERIQQAFERPASDPVMAEAVARSIDFYLRMTKLQKKK